MWFAGLVTFVLGFDFIPVLGLFSSVIRKGFDDSWKSKSSLRYFSVVDELYYFKAIVSSEDYTRQVK